MLINNRALFIAEAAKNNIELGEWFISPIHPIMKDYHFWFYDYGKYPVAEDISSKIINLPTHFGINSNKLKKVLAFLTKYKHLIE